MNEKVKSSNFIAAIFILILSFNNLSVYSQTEIPDSVVRERIKVIEKILIQDKPNADLWWWGWLGGYTAATIGQGIVCITADEKGLRQDMALGAATTLLGAAGQLLSPMQSCTAPERLAHQSEETREARLEKLKNAEGLLKECAMREKSGRSWKVHAVTSVVNVGSGLITWLGFKRDVWAGVGNFALNTVITEAQIWTQPTRAVKNYQDYCRKYKSEGNPVTAKSGLTWFVYSGPGGVGLKIIF